MRNFGLKIKLNPDENTKLFFANNFGCSRLVFNYFLNKRISYYKNYKQTYSSYDCIKFLSAFLKRSEEYSFLNNVESTSLQKSIENLDTAYNNFFKNKAKFPKFKSKRDYNQSFTIKCIYSKDKDTANIKVNNVGVKLPKLKTYVPFFKPSKRDLKTITKINNGICRIKSATIKLTGPNYYISFCLEEETYSLNEFKTINSNKITGIDLGIETYATCFNGSNFNEILNPNKDMTKLNNKIKITQKSLSKKYKQGIKSKDQSKNYKKQHLKLNKLHHKVAMKRLYFLHKISKTLVNENQVLVFENLSIQTMLKTPYLSKEIANQSWYKFLTLCKYKALWSNKTVLQIDRYYPSSKLCSKCGYKNEDLELKDRTWECPDCKTMHNRDKNAAINLRNHGLKELIKEGFTII